MAVSQSLVKNFKEHLKISQNVLMYKCEENKFALAIYCLEKDINVQNELDYLNLLFKKHSLAWMNLCPFEVKKIISIRKIYPSTFSFTSRKQCQ